MTLILNQTALHQRIQTPASDLLRQPGLEGRGWLYNTSHLQSGCPKEGEVLGFQFRRMSILATSIPNCSR